MDVALAAAALLLAAAAWVRAGRRRPASPPPPAPPAPVRAPAGGVEPTVVAPAAPAGAGADVVAALLARIDELEARCLALESRPATLVPGAPPPVEPLPDAPPAEEVRRALEARGFEAVHVTAPPDGPAEVEASRGGTVWKGRVDAARPERAAEGLRPARRVFP
jgi:hypothetical protein